MSTLTIGATSLFKSLFPESDWTRMSPADYEQVLQKLANGGTLNSRAAEFMQKSRVKLGFHEQYKSGAGWTVLHDITLAADENPTDPYTLSLISHELFHLQQSLFTRLSVFGELLAWQYQKQAYHDLTGKEIGDPGEAYPGTQQFWDQLGQLSPESRDDLLKGQALMKSVAPSYRSDCLPLYPLGREFWYFLKQGRIGEAFNVIKDLITCK